VCTKQKSFVAHLFLNSLKQAARNTNQLAAALAEVAACSNATEFDKLSKKRSSQSCLCPVLVLFTFYFISDSRPLHRHANRTKFSKPEYLTSGKLLCNASPTSDELLTSATIVILPVGMEADFSVVAAAAALFPKALAIGNDRDFVLRNSTEHGPPVIRLLSQGNCVLYAPGGIFGCANVYALAMVEWEAKIVIAKANMTKTKINLARQKRGLRDLQQLVRHFWVSLSLLY
jgi:hypothetical protein